MLLDTKNCRTLVMTDKTAIQSQSIDEPDTAPRAINMINLLFSFIFTEFRAFCKGPELPAAAVLYNRIVYSCWKI
jgi:hypothetical protein